MPMTALMHAQGLPRNHAWSRWDEMVYWLYEKGDMTRAWAKFCRTKGFAIEIRELPEPVEHSLIFFALGYLILMEADFASQWSWTEYHHRERKDHPAPASFSVASLQQTARELMTIE